MSTILIAGYYGAGNIGDEAILKALLSDFREKREDLDFIVISLDPIETEIRHNVRSVLYTDITSILDAIKESHLIILGGGGLYHDYWGVNESDLLTSRHIGIPFYSGFPVLAKIYKKPIMIYSVGVGPLFSEPGKRLTRASFKMADLATVRDSDSKKILADLGVSTENILVTADPSFLLKKIDKEKAKENLASYHLSDLPLVVVCLRNWEFDVSPQIWQKEVAEALDEFVKKNDVQLLFIPFQQSLTDTLIDDLSVTKNVISMMKRTNNSVILESINDPETICGIIAHCDLVVGMRLHSLIFSFNEGVPAVGIAYDPKVTYSMRSFGMEKFCINLSQLKSKVLLDKMEQAWANKVQLSFDIVKKVEEFKILARDNSKLAFSLLEGNSLTQNKSSEGEDFIDNLLINQIRNQAEVDNFNQYLSTELFEKKQMVDMLEAQIAENKQIIGEHNTRVNELNNQLTEKEITIQDFNNRVENLRIQLIEKDQIFLQIRGELKELQTISIEKDQQLQRLEVQLEDLTSRILKAEQKNIAFKQSKSWKITRPLRFLGQFTKSPKQAMVSLKDYIYWRVRQRGKIVLGKLHQQVHKTTSEKSDYITNLQPITKKRDLSWEEFKSQILSRRHEYKGIYIQERNVDWAISLFQRPQHIASALGRAGYLVLYKVWVPGIDSVKGFKSVDQNVWLTTCDEVDMIPGALRSIYSTAYFFPEDGFEKRRELGVMVYEYIDHIDPSITGKESIEASERLKRLAFSGMVDFVVTSAESLRKEAVAAIGEEKVILIPNGVSTEHYRNPKHCGVSLPEQLLQFRSKYKYIIGYFGAIAPWLWYEVINELVKLRSDLGFVFIGPDYFDSAKKLPLAKNLIHLDYIDYSILPASAQLFDVCWIPFILGDLAKATSPLKLFEYFALEKPIVVTSDMLECIAYKEVLHAKTAEGLSSAIDQALDKVGDEIFQARLRNLADENDWNERAKIYEKCFVPLRDWNPKS